MDKLVFLVIMVSTIFGNDSYRKRLDDCNMMYIYYKSEYQIVSNTKSYDPCLRLGKVDRSSFAIEEPQDEIDFLEFQKKTLGVACEQVRNGIQVSFKNDYCMNLTKQSTVNTIKPSLPPSQQSIQRIQQAEPVDPAVKFKNTPQLKLEKLHIYAVKNISHFRGKNDVFMIESEMGNFAVPIEEIKKAEQINFTAELTQKLDALLH